MHQVMVKRDDRSSEVAGFVGDLSSNIEHVCLVWDTT
jgi:hypothetical protein